MKEYTKTHSDFIALKYVVRATAKAKDTSEPVFCCLYVETKNSICYIVGSNTHRLHIAELPEPVEDGLYRIVRADAKSITIDKVGVVGHYPNMWRVIPDLNLYDVEENVKESKHTHNTDILFPIFKHNVKANAGYLVDAVLESGTCYLKSKDNNAPIVITCGTNIAVVMPMEQKNRNEGEVKMVRGEK